MGHTQGSRAECQICEVRFVRPWEMSNEIRSWKDLDCGMGQDKQFGTETMNHAEMIELAVSGASPGGRAWI